MASWDQVRTQHRPALQTARVPMRGDLLDEIEALELQARAAAIADEKLNRDPEAPAIAERIQELEVELEESVVEFKFRAVGRRLEADLLAQHPPTDAGRAKAEAEGVTAQWNQDTYPPALMAAACVEPPDATVEDFAHLWENWSKGQLTPLWAACLKANMGAADAGPKSAIASAILSGSARSSITADR